MAKTIRLFFASDVHGSEKCYRKFLNAAAVYKADVLVLGGDVAGKAIQPVIHQGEGVYTCNFRGADYRATTEDELKVLERTVADYGYYAYRAEPGEMEAHQREGRIDRLFLDLMRNRLEAWTALADERLRPQDKPIFFMLGNDDPPELVQVLEDAPWGHGAEGHILPIGEHELLSYGYANRTPWDSYRELDEDELARRIGALAADLQYPERAIFNLHVPPHDSGLDQAPVLDSALRVQQSLGQVKFAPVGSTAVRDMIEQWHPLVSLHGHVHESAGFSRIGCTLSVNPGSDYGTGTLNGAILTLERDKVKAHQFVRG